MNLKYGYFSLLIVDNDKDICSIVVEYFRGIFSRVYHAYDQKLGLEIYDDFRPDVVIADINMPHINGLALARKIKNINSSTLVYIATASTTEDYLLEGIEIGVDGWLKKPFQPFVVLEKIDKMYASFFKNKDIKIGKNILYSPMQHQVTVGKKTIILTRKENELLSLFVKNANKIVDYDMIGYSIYKDGFMFENALRVLVNSLRQKIPPLPLSNIFGVGYRLIVY